MVISLTGTKWSLHHTRSQLRFYLGWHVSLECPWPSTYLVHSLPSELRKNKKTASSQARYSAVMTGTTMPLTRLSSQKENVFSQSNSA